ncbi:MAG: helix-turn-helix domain-containing protein [Lentisphaerae bacterium]|jgi:excisionase family DNA binding protein|nr:helix-turn-helix domain-containing protein [Lentisphaerota bacterium]
MTTEKSHYSLEEVATMLGVTYQLIYRLVRSGELPAIRLGKLYRVSKQDLEKYLEGARATAVGVDCGACGRHYNSRLSAQHACEVCDAPICNDCWQRNALRRCAAHMEEVSKKK